MNETLIVRLEYTKLGKVRFTGHRDVARIWERALRKAGLPIAYTEGFSPRPKLSFGLALPTGYESHSEFLDVHLAPDRGDIDGVDIAELPARLSEALPVGMDTIAAAQVPRGTLSLQQAVTSCEWRIDTVDTDRAEATIWMERILSAPSLVVTRERKGKEVIDDLRPQVFHLSIDDPGPDRTGVSIGAQLGTQPRVLRPTELLRVVEPPLDAAKVTRMKQLTDTDGARREPLALGAAVAAPAGVTA